jgi:hypothetical protein
MGKSTISRAGKKRRGRPATNPASIHLTLLPDPLAAVDEWIDRQDDAPSRPEAIRRLVEMGLAAAQHAPLKNKRAAAKARKMARATIDQMSDTSAPLDEQAKRKRRLIKGPPEFREMRADVPKPKG